MRFSQTLIILAPLLAFTAALPVRAQDQAPAAPRPTDVQNIGDWTVRCFPVKSVSPCDMYEQLNDKNSHQLVLAVSIAYVPSVDRHAMQIVVPLGVSIPKGAVIQASNFTSDTLPYRRCDRAGCYIEMMMPNNSIDSFAHADPAAKLKIVSDDGRTYDLNFSLKGFTEAHDAMTVLSKQKAAKPGDQSAAAPTKK